MEKEQFTPEEEPKKRNLIVSLIVGVLGGFSAIYLLNPSAGFVELIPDNIPGVGNLDEAAAAALLISCLAYFGIDLGGVFGRKSKNVDSSAEVIDAEVKEEH